MSEVTDGCLFNEDLLPCAPLSMAGGYSVVAGQLHLTVYSLLRSCTQCGFQFRKISLVENFVFSQRLLRGLLDSETGQAQANLRNCGLNTKVIDEAPQPEMKRLAASR